MIEIFLFLVVTGAFFLAINVGEKAIRDVLTRKRLDRLERMVENKKKQSVAPEQRG